MCELALKHGARSSKKKLPRNTTVAALKLLCERLFKVKADRQALLLADPDTGAVEDIAQDDTRELAFYNIQVCQQLPCRTPIKASGHCTVVAYLINLNT